MKKISYEIVMFLSKKLFLLYTILCFVLPAFALNPKREFRATWLTTVRNVDWPSYQGMSAKSMQDEMTKLLDSIQTLNLNTVCFQVRCNADAFYKSKYEPWSALMTGTRGKDPGFDPLQMWLDECHKRGLQLHAWINPYRYNNQKAMWDDGCEMGYEYTHPEWLFIAPKDNCVVMDPGLPEVRQRVKEVVGDILHNYDIDGIIFDDYFYPYGGTTVQDTASQRLYKPAGMVVQDWRRENIRQMVQDVYDTIMAVNPHVTFGISPFGIWTNDTYVARQHGLTLPKGIGSSANMYAEIYCDPITWLEDGTVDYISPQLYWATSSKQPYATLCSWWAGIANRFGRHFYSSMSTDSYSRGVSGFTMLEMRTETDLNRSSSTDGAFGSIFFHTKGWVYDSKFRYQYSLTRFSSPALPPAVNWKKTDILPLVENLQLQGQKLTWKAVSGNNIRYAVYAVPASYADSVRVFSRSDVLLAVTFTNSYTLPAGISAADYRIAVSVIDGYWNEFSLKVLGEPLMPEEKAVLQYPLGSESELSWSWLIFRWNEVKDAYAYEIQIATDEDFNHILAAQEVETNSFNAENRLNLALAGLGDYYWRVRTKKANMTDTWSEPVHFTVNSTAVHSALELLPANAVHAQKIVEDGVIYILRNGEKYNVLGHKVQ